MSLTASKAWGGLLTTDPITAADRKKLSAFVECCVVHVRDHYVTAGVAEALAEFQRLTWLKQRTCDVAATPFYTVTHTTAVRTRKNRNATRKIIAKLQGLGIIKVYGWRREGKYGHFNFSIAWSKVLKWAAENFFVSRRTEIDRTAAGQWYEAREAHAAEKRNAEDRRRSDDANRRLAEEVRYILDQADHGRRERWKAGFLDRHTNDRRGRRVSDADRQSFWASCLTLLD